jgi:hypothetical protein
MATRAGPNAVLRCAGSRAIGESEVFSVTSHFHSRIPTRTSLPESRSKRWSETTAFLRFLAEVPGFVRRRMSYDEACKVIRERLRSREANFLALLDAKVFRNPASPYRAMLQIAGCEHGDVTHMVRDLGLEGTLHALRRAGVGVSFEEFKGRVPIVRSGREIPSNSQSFDNPQRVGAVPRQSGGSSGPPRQSNLSIASLSSGTPHATVLSHLDGGPEMPRILCYGILPSVGLGIELRGAAAGLVHRHWLSPMWPGHGVPTRYLHMSRLVVVAARLAGAPMPMPRFVPFSDSLSVAQLAAQLVVRFGGCQVRGSVSRMVRVALAAREAGIDLRGATLMGGGEPPTPAKVAAIRSSGATFTSTYQFSEIGMAGALCRDSDDPNDQHVMLDHLALIQAPRQVPGFQVEVNAFCFTSLLPEARKILLNTESDDYGTLTTRACGCPWGALGLTQHVSGIRSFRKFTAEVVSLPGADLEQILQEVLPAAHGGTPLDYQLLEEEEDGLTRVIFLVDPSIQGLEPAAVVETFLSTLARHTTLPFLAYWRQSGVVRVRRESPRWSAGGKLLPLHIDRQMTT